MKLSVSFVPVRKIKPSASRWNFSIEAIEQAARLITKVEGIINPLILRQEDGLESFAVLDGNFEYYAAARASELEPERCETIAAFIAEPQEESLIRQQIELFRNSCVIPLRSNYSELDDAADSNVRLSQVEARQAKLEARQIMLETRELQSLRQQVADLSQQLHYKIDLLQLFNQAEPDELQNQMKRVGLVGKTAERILETIESERQQKRFVSLKEVVSRVKGLTYEKIIDLLEV